MLNCKIIWDRSIILFIWIAITLTLTFSILPTTNIAELILTSASHGVASITFLYPELATGTLLEFSSFDKKHKHLVVFPQISYLFVLLARHVCMVFTLASETIIFLASWASILTQSLVKGKDSTTSRSRTPACIIHILFHIVMKSKVLILLFQFSIQELSYLFI